MASLPTLVSIRSRLSNSMTQQPINPYEPSHIPGSTATGESLAFKGTIEKGDYQEMLPRWDLERWLCCVLAILLTICILVFGPVSVLFAISDGHLAVAIGLVCFWTVMVAALWFLKRRVSSVDLANRMLRKNPDLLGPASGMISDYGVTFNDGVRTYWFGSEIAKKATIRDNGIRVAFDGNSYRYLALTSRLFDKYREETARRIQQHWASYQAVEATAKAAFARESWERVCERPADAVSFDGLVTSEQPSAELSSWKRTLSEVLIYGAGLALFIYYRAFLGPWIVWLGALALGYSLAQSIVASWTYSRRMTEQAWHQFGWFSNTEFAISSNKSGVRMPLTDLAEINANDEAVFVVLLSGASYFIPRHCVTTDALWELMRSLASDYLGSERLKTQATKKGSQPGDLK